MREISHGRWEGLTRREVEEQFGALVYEAALVRLGSDLSTDGAARLRREQLGRVEPARGGGEAKWKVENGYMEVVPRTGVLRTRDEFGDFQLHLEFATPEKVNPNEKGQGRGNNGVNIFGQYEIQVLDSYKNETYADGGAASLYGQWPPLVSAPRPPGEWQTYDIIFEGPRWDDSGKVTRKASATVFHNGVLIHNKTEFFGPTGHKNFGNYDKPGRTKGPIELYEHGNPVRFRNIWIRETKGYDAGGAAPAADAK